MADEKYDIGLISNDKRVISRCKTICSEFGYSMRDWEDLEKFVASPAEYGMVLAYLPESKNTNEAAAEFAQAIRFVCKDSFIACTVSNKVSRETAQFIKKSGANLIVLENELFDTSKLEYVTTQVLKAGYIPIKVSDLVPGTQIRFDIYHLLLQRKKFLKSAFNEDELTDDKLKKFTQVGELYVHRSELEGFGKYMRERHSGSQKEGLAKRCRGMFLALYGGYANLMFLLTDQSEHASYTEGLALLKKLEDTSQELISLIAEFGNAWDIINNSSIGEFGSIERAPSIAAHAALLGLELGVNNIRDIMLASLLGDIGLVFLPPSVTQKIRADKLEKLSDEERAAYQKYPLKSQEIILDRKLPLDPKLREILLTTHERADGKGFPKGVSGSNLGEGAQIVRFCRELDRRTTLKLGQARVDPMEVRKQLIRDQIKSLEWFTPGFLAKLKKTYLAGE